MEMSLCFKLFTSALLNSNTNAPQKKNVPTCMKILPLIANLRKTKASQQKTNLIFGNKKSKYTDYKKKKHKLEQY